MGSKETTDGVTISKIVTYDAAGRVISTKVPFDIINGIQYYSTSTFVYNADGSIRESGVMCNAPGSADNKRTTAYEYDSRGNIVLVKLTDGTKDNYTQYYYDENGRLRRVYQGLSARLTITAMDTVTPGTDSQYSVIKYDYDKAGNLATKTDADNFLTTYVSYDQDGNLTKSIDPNGSITTYQYDNMGRITYKEVIDTDASKSCKESHVYIDPVNGSTTEQEIIKVTNGFNQPVTTTRTMDTSHQLVEEEIQESDETGTQGIQKLYTYNVDGSTKSFGVKINNVTKLALSYDYTTQGQLKTLKENGTVVASYTYDGEGKLNTKAMGALNQTYSYNQLGAIKTNATSTNGTNIFNETLQRNVDGKISAIGEGVSGRSQNFTYDKMGRILTAIDNGDTTNYTYDDYHNILTKGSTTNSYNTSGTKLTNANYDSNGNTTKDSSMNTYAYDAINRMQQAVTSGVTTTYDYDSDDMISSRINKDGTTLYVWDGDQIVMELDANKNVVSKYIRGNEELLKAENADGSLKWYYVNDSHGNVVKLLNGSYATTKFYTYDAYGLEQNIDSADTNPFRYCGEYYDKYSDAVFLRARSYSPSMGRFIEMDSFAGDYKNPLSLNLYTYCENDAINGVDPSGHWKFWKNIGDFFKGFGDGFVNSFTSIPTSISDTYNSIKKDPLRNGLGALGGLCYSIYCPSDPIGNYYAMKNGPKAIGEYYGNSFGGYSMMLASEGIGRGFSKIGSLSKATRVGRWMSKTEYMNMKKTKKVQLIFDHKTCVSNPADLTSFAKQAGKGSVYVEFNVPSNTLTQGGTAGWGIVNGPGSLYDRLLAKKGLPRIKRAPKATNIKKIGSK